MFPLHFQSTLFHTASCPPFSPLLYFSPYSMLPPETLDIYFFIFCLPFFIVCKLHEGGRFVHFVVTSTVPKQCLERSKHSKNIG